MKNYTEQDIAAIKDFMKMNNYGDFKTFEGFERRVLDENWIDIEFESELTYDEVSMLAKEIFNGKL